MTELFVVEYECYQLGMKKYWENVYETKSLRSATETCEWYRNNGYVARIKSHMVNAYGQIVEEV